MAAALTQPLISSTDGDNATAREGISSGLPSTGTQPGWLNSKELHAHLVAPEVTRQPPSDERPDGLGHPPAQEQGRRPLRQKS
jgi:hypothetical protein